MGVQRTSAKGRPRKRPSRRAPPPRLLLAATSQALGRAKVAVESTEMQPEDRVHDLRVALKRLRTFWRLARPHVSAVVWTHERDRLRALGAALAAFRDADVARSVVETHVRQAGDAAVRSLMKRWAESKWTLAGPPDARERALRNVARRMTGVAAKLDRAGGRALTWEWLEPGLAWVYRRGRKAWRKCRYGKNDLEFHAWRRRVKDLQYQMDLLRPLAPHRLGRLRRRIQEVGEALGEAHDLMELRDALERTFAAVRNEGWSSALSHNRRDLLERIHRAMDGKYRLALKDGQTIYAASTKVWLRGLHKAWNHKAGRQGAGRKPTVENQAKLT